MISMASASECYVCHKPGGMPCSRCRVDAYCGKQHQLQDWPRHKAGCGVYKLQDGRLRAVKDIKKGTVIIKEAPVVVAPLPQSSSQVMCVGCCYEITGGLAKALQCGVCSLPVCCKQCAKDPAHQDECGVLRDAGYKAKRGDLERHLADWLMAVPALRVALAARREPRLRSLRTDLTEGRDELKPLLFTKTAVFPLGMIYQVLHDQDDEKQFFTERAQRERVVRLLRVTVGVTKLSEQELVHAATLFDLHSVGNKRVRPGGKDLLKGWLYLGSSQLEHNCVPNTVVLDWREHNNPLRETVVVAGRDIAKNEFLSRDLTMGLCWTLNTLDRQNTLLSKYAFVCRCRRCEDPSELDQYVGSIHCRVCAGKGENHLMTISKDAQSWSCKGCRQEIEAGEYGWLTEDIIQELKALEAEGADPKKWMAFLERIQRPGSLLHPMHTAVLQAKSNLHDSIRLHKADADASDRDSASWERLCRDLLKAMDRLCPGMQEPRRLVLNTLRNLLLKRYDDTKHQGRYVSLRGLSRTDGSLDAAIGGFAHDYVNRKALEEQLGLAHSLCAEYVYGITFPKTAGD